MIIYTQLIFIKLGKEKIFHEFEERVLPLLAKYGGELLYRLRPNLSEELVSTLGHPYEIHLVSFKTKKDFEAYRDDPARTNYVKLKNESVEKIMLIEGEKI